MLIIAFGFFGALTQLPDVSDLAQRLTGMTAVSGFEQAMGDSLLQLVPGAQRDRAGNVVALLGEGEPTRAVVCPMDEPGYVVGGVHEGGYITLRAVGAGAPAWFHQSHAGRRVTVWSRNGPVPAVVSIPSTHLRRGRPGQSDLPFSADDLILDVGARSPDEVAALGVAVLDPVTLEKRPHRYGEDLLSGPHVAGRSACAALIAVYNDPPRISGSIVVAWTVESRLGHRGLQTLVNGYGPFAATFLLDYPAQRRMDDRFGETTSVVLERRYDGWQVETVEVSDIQDLVDGIERWLGGTQ